MSTIHDCIPLLNSVSLTERNYNTLYIDKQCCIIQLINRIIFLICGSRGYCLRKARGSISIQDEYKVMKQYALAKKALCAKQAESIDLIVKAYFARRVQLSAAFNLILLNQAFTQDLQAAGIETAVLSKIQQKIEPELTAPFLPSPLTSEATVSSNSAASLPNEPKRLAAELMLAFVQAGKNVEATESAMNDYLSYLHKYVQGPAVQIDDFRIFYHHIDADLYQAYREYNRMAPDARSPEYDKLYIPYDHYISLKQGIIQKIYIDPKMCQEQFFFSLFSSEWNDMISPPTLACLFNTTNPLSRITHSVKHMFSVLGSAYRTIGKLMHPSQEDIRREEAEAFAHLALIHILSQTSKKHIASYQEWLDSDKETRLHDTSLYARREEGDADVEQVARVLPLFQKPLDSFSRKDMKTIDALMKKILHTSRGSPAGNSSPLFIFEEEVEKIAKIVLALPIDPTLSEEETRALESLKERQRSASKREWHHSNLILFTSDAEEIAWTIFRLRRVLTGETLSKGNFQIISSFMNILEDLNWSAV